MWNNLAEFVQDRGTKRLALAIVVSAILHAYLVGGLNARLPSLKKEMHTIEARLQMPKVVVKQLPAETQAGKTVADKATAKEVLAEEMQTQPEATPLQQTLQEPIATPVPNLSTQNLNTSAPEQADISNLVPAEPAPAENIELAQTELQPIDAGLVINENAYQYVETDFDVRTEIDGAVEGTAKIVFNLVDGKQYQLTSLIKPKGLAALIVSQLRQTSSGQLTKNGLQPLNYQYQYGDNADKTYSATFDWPNKMVSLVTIKGTKTQEIAEGTQDLLSFMYQFMYVAPLERMQISIATGKKLALYDYSFAGEENLNTPLGEIKTLHIVHQSEQSDEKTELWLALDYQYLPVKIRKIEKNGRLYELLASRINTARPTLN